MGTKPKTETDISLILSGVRALTGEITSPLRSASIEMRNNTVVFKCVFDQTATSEDFELVSAAAAEIIADFPDYKLEEIVETVAPPGATDPLKNILFQRHESNYWK